MKQRLFKKDYHKLQEELDEFDKRLREAEDERSAFHAMIRDQASEIEKQKMELQGVQEYLIAQKERLAEVHSDREKLLATLRMTQAESGRSVQDLERRLKDERDEKGQREEEIRDLQGQLQESRSCVETLRGEIDRLMENLCGLQREKEVHIGIIRDTQRKVEELTAALEEEQSVNGQLTLEINRLKEELARDEAEIGRFQDRTLQVEGQLRQLQQEKGELEKRAQPAIVRLAVWLAWNLGPRPR